MSSGANPIGWPPSPSGRQLVLVTGRPPRRGPGHRPRRLPTAPGKRRTSCRRGTPRPSAQSRP
eukprot:6286886-Alexandrium_andersonii.AAC.1